MGIDMQKYGKLKRKAKHYISVMDSLTIPISEREVAKIAYFATVLEIAAMYENAEEDKANV